MDWWLANFFLGAIFSLFLPVVPDLFVLILLLLLSFFFFFFYFYQPIHTYINAPKICRPLQLSSGLLFGASWMLFNALSFQSIWQSNQLDALELSNKAQWVQGTVLSLQLANEQNKLLNSATKTNTAKPMSTQLRFNMLVTALNNKKLNHAIQMRLSWKKNTLALQQGQVVNLKVKFKPSHGLSNQGGFSYQTWLNSNAISATGYVLKHKNNKLVNSENTIKQQLLYKYTALLINEHDINKLAPLLLALGFGFRGALTPETWHVLQATGTGHLIAISGLHIGLVATGSFYIAMLLLRLFPVAMFAQRHKLQTINYRYYAIAISIFVAFGYGYLAGFSLPTVRALVMLSVYWIIRLLTIKISIKRWLLLTLLIITLITPFSLFTASFWLSFYAVTIIFLTLWRFRSFLKKGAKLWRFIKGLVVIQLSLTVMLLPISALFFQQISVVSLFANIFAVPWMSFISIPLCLLSVLIMPISTAASQFLIELCLGSLTLLWHYLDSLSVMPWAVIALSTAQVQLLVFAGLVMILLVFFQAKIMFAFKYANLIRDKKRIVIACSLLASCFFIVALANKSSKQPTHWQLVVFDVGQGLAVLVQHENKAVLYDTGAAYSSGFNMIDAVVVPYLKHANIRQLDKVIISHSDNDHAGGLTALQQSITIKELIYNTSKSTSKIKKRSTCLQGQTFSWQGLTFEMLWPTQRVAKENDDSCVLLIGDDKHKVLLSGDISKTVESKLLQQYPSLQVDVLIVPHHGSKTSSSKAFIEQVNPKIAVVSAGFLNRWHMPYFDVVYRYQQNNSLLLNSANLGQITIDFSEKGIRYYSFREDLWPFWFAKSLR